METYNEMLKKALYLNKEYSIEKLAIFYAEEKNKKNIEFDNENDLAKASLFEEITKLIKNGLNDTKLREHTNNKKLIKDLIREETEIGPFNRIKVNRKRESILDQRLRTLQSLFPKKTFSNKYKIIFFKSVLYIFMEAVENGTNDYQVIRRHYQEISKKTYESHFYLFYCFYNIFDEFVLNRKKNSKEEQRYLIKYLKYCKIIIKHNLKEYTNKSVFNDNDIYQLCVYGQILSFVIAVEQNDGDQSLHVDEREAIAYIAYYLAEAFWAKTPSEAKEGVPFAKLGLLIRNPSDRQDAFNILGLCAMDSGEYTQLAYDTYFSWLNNRTVGDLISILPDNFLKDNMDTNWRTDAGKILEAIMHNNFAYLCSEISDTYEINSSRQKSFYKIAIDEIEKAIKLDPDNADYHHTYGSILSDGAGQDYKSAIKQYEESYNLRKADVSDKIKALRNYCITSLQLLSKTYIESDRDKCDFNQWIEQEEEIKTDFNNMIKYMNTVIKDIDNLNTNKIELTNEQEIYGGCKYIFDLHKRMDNYNNSPEIHNIECILMLISGMVSLIKINLRRYEYSKTDYYTRDSDSDQSVNGTRGDIKAIAYYTTLNTIQHVFEDLYQSPSELVPRRAEMNEDGKNCLTMMHARYMNDPHEGLTLLNVLRKNIDEQKDEENLIFSDASAESFREEIYKDYFIFMKSFTESIDKLIMWNRYASDFNHGGRDSNGCCVQLDPEVFNNLINQGDSNEDSTKMKSITDDDYYLYRIVYISKDGSIEDTHNPNLVPQVKKCYENLKRLINTLNKSLCNEELKKILGNDWNDFIVYVRGYIQQSLRSIIFLFKDDDYSEELESRIILTRTSSQQEEIRIIPGFPSKICINPYFQVYISRLIFGPNVRDYDEWKPYFQIQLNKMWKKHPELINNPEIEPQEKYSIVKSDIHYHT